MASAESMTAEEEIELDCAVLDVLTSRFNDTLASPQGDKADDESWYPTEGEDEMKIFYSEDWQDLYVGRNNQPLLEEKFLRLYDEHRRTMYYVEVVRPRQSCSNFEVYESDQGPPRNSPKRSNMTDVLARLRIDNGRFVPRGYQTWMAEKLQSRFPVRNDIPGYAALCDNCHRVLTHSLVFYNKLLRRPVVSANIPGRPAYTGPRRDIFRHYASTKALNASASTGCHLCSFMNAPSADGRDSATSTQPIDTPYFMTIEYDDLRFGDDPNQGRIRIHARDCSTKYTRLEWQLDHEEGSSTLTYSRTDAPQVLQLAKTWLTRCITEDKMTCSMPQRFIPTRLISVTSSEGTPVSARLVMGDKLPIDTQYLTLSHCWGNTVMTTLNNSTLDDYQDDIPLPSLSKTFRDALKVTVWLGYQYIWIDSICIQQDSETDWAREAAMMGAVYQYSTCTIAASGAVDGSVGLFLERSALAFLSCPILRTSDGYTLLATGYGRKWPTPLSSRAWALQERVLSPRILSFGSDRISWACRRSEVCEGTSACGLGLRIDSFAKIFDPNVSQNEAWDAWVQIKQQYSSSKLTYWKDKWPAFQGLSSEVAKMQGWTLAHGLRHDVLGTDLLWWACDPETGTLEQGQPSWSWLNMKDGVLWPASLAWNECYLDADITMQHESTQQGATTTDLALSYRIIRIEACMPELKISTPKPDRGRVPCTLTVTNPLFRPDELTRLLHVLWYPDSLPISNSPMYAVQIIKSSKNRENEFNYSIGLVIAPVEGRPGIWRRTGIYSYMKDNPSTEEDRICPWSQEKTTIFLI